jgi:hypothetical protein
MNMNAAVYAEDLQSLQAILHDGLEGTPLDFQCRSQAGALMILGQHSAELRLETGDLLRHLERRIQALQLRFVQQARLYLRIKGETHPYAQRFFLIQPPPPPLPKATTQGSFQTFAAAESTRPTTSDNEFWAVSDEELDELVNELVGPVEITSLQAVPMPDAIAPTKPLTLVNEEPAPAEDEKIRFNGFDTTTALPALTGNDTEEASSINLSAFVAEPPVTDAVDAEPAIADPFALDAAEPDTNPSTSLSLIPWEGEPEMLMDPAQIHTMAGNLLPPLVAAPRPATSEVASETHASRRLWLGGAIALGVVGGVYGVSRPCVVGSCSELQTAQDLEQAAVQQAEATQDVEGLAEAQGQLQQAIATLETIPPWSNRASRAREQQQLYETHALTLATLTEVARVAQTARDRTEEAPLSVETWNRIISPFETAINRLNGVSPANPFYASAQQQQQVYEAQLARYLRQRDMEQDAQETLSMARQGIEMAEARQQIAQSKEQWQMVRITWQVVVNRLSEVPAGSYAAIEAERLLQSYEPRLDAATAQMQREATAVDRLNQAAEYAQQASASAHQFNWQGAIAAWTNAIRETEQIPPGTTSASEGETLARQYQNAIDDAQENLDNYRAVSLEIDRACNEEFRKCRLLTVSEEIRVELSADYLAAIAVARNSGNRELQAVVTEHQLGLRRTLQELAVRFQRPIEVYDNGNNLLDRHLPNASTT